MDSYTSSSDMSGGMIAAIFAVLFIPLLIIGLICLISQWKIYTKAGKPGWAAIVPVYNYIVWLEIIGKPMWWLAILLLVPCVNFIFLIWMLNLLSKSFGKSEGFTVGLFFLPFIFFPILAFGGAQYLGPSAKEAQGTAFNPNDYRDPFNNQNNPPPQNY
jgi:hypothetical protein